MNIFYSPVNPNKPCRLEKEVMNSLDVVSVKAYDSNWEELPVVLKFSFGENSPIQANSANQPRLVYNDKQTKQHLCFQFLCKWRSEKVITIDRFLGFQIFFFRLMPF